MTNLKVVTQNEQKSYVRKIDVALNFGKMNLSKVIDCINNLFPEMTVTIKEIKQESSFHLLDDHVYNHEIQIVIDQPISGYKVELLHLLLSNHVLYKNFEIKIVEDTDETILGYNKTYLLNNDWISVYLSEEAGLLNPEFIKDVCKHQRLSIAYCTDESDLLNKVKSLFDSFIEYNK